MFRRIDTVRLDIAVTKMRLRPIIRVLTKKLVTANAEQIPKICRKTGFSLHKPEMKIVLLLNLAMRNTLRFQTSRW